MTNHAPDINYQQAWQEIGETERCVLLLMLLALDSGSDFEYLAAVGGQADNLSPTEIRDVLETLINCNLVINHNDPPNRRYAIRSRTRDFLHKLVLEGEDDDPIQSSSTDLERGENAQVD